MADPRYGENAFNPQSGYGAVAGQIINLPKEPSIAALLSQQAEDLSRAEDALRAALNRLRGSRPEPANTGLNQAGGPISPSITDRIGVNARASCTVALLANELSALLE